MASHKAYIYGIGGMASLFYYIALKNGVSIDGFCIEDEYLSGDLICDKPLTPFSQLKELAGKSEISLYIAVGPIRMNRIRERIFKEAKEAGFILPNFICDSVYQVPPFTLGEGNIMLNSGCIHSGVIMGDNNFLSSTVTLGHGVNMGDGNFFAGGVIVAGETRIQNRCFFGLGVTVSDNLIIEDESFIGQGCAITKSTEAAGTYTAPAAIKQKFTSSRFCDLVF